MKKYLLSLFALVLLVAGLTGTPIQKDKPIISKQMMASAEEVVEYTSDESTEEKDEICICVIGNASKSVSPDRACITARIETLDLDLVKSKDNNFVAFEESLKSLEKAGISRENVIMESFTSYPSYDYSNAKTLAGYYSVTTFSFSIDNLEDTKKVIDAVTENGVTSISSVRYEVSNMEDEYSNVLMSALENAKMKAGKMLGREDLSVMKIREETVYCSNNLYRSYEAGLSSTAYVGKVEIKARVVVDFE